MKILFFLSLFLMGSCASRIPYDFPEEKGVSCYNTTELNEEKKRVCLRVNSFQDPVKWHRVMPWQQLPKIPDLP